jgi:metal-responsive CopG/Arc/MetJ family transcriptional regulator
MANSVKTAISLPGDLLRKINEMSRDMDVSRSKFFVLAAQEFIKKQENRKLLSRINKAFSDYPDPNEKKLGQAMRQKQAKQSGNEPW